MSEALRSLAEQAERIHAEYRRHFAGRARYTRELSRLDTLLADIRKLVAQAQTVPGADAELLPVLSQRLELYGAERQAIASVQAGGEDEAVAYRTGEWTRLVRRRYIRAFAGQNRLTRDLGLLQSMAADQRRWRDELRAVAARHEAGWHQEELGLMDDNVGIFETEAKAIEDAVAALEPERRAQVLATLANAQFDSWRLHFQGKTRGGRRPALLRRMIGSLERIHRDMLAVRDQGFNESFHQGNIENVAGRIRAWKEELRLIEGARATRDPDEVGATLGDEANKWFNEYRAQFAGKPRQGLDIDGLARVCEGLFEVALTMEDQHATWRRKLNARNLDIVIENLKAYEREFEQVREAQKQTA